MDAERWVQILNYNYSVSDRGRVRNDTTNRILLPILTGAHSKYKTVVIRGKNLKVHRLVAYYYVANPKNLLQVNHLDEDKLNNDYRNLVWVTNRENKSYNPRGSSKYVGVIFDKARKKWRAEIRIGKSKVYLGRFDSELQAAKAYKKYIQRHSITNKYCTV